MSVDHKSQQAEPLPPAPPPAHGLAGGLVGRAQLQADVEGLIEAAKASAAAAASFEAIARDLLQSVAMLAGAVAQLLEEEAGTPAPPEEPAKPGPDDLDAD